VSIRV